MGQQTRWTIVMSRETESAVRSWLAERGNAKGDLSKFIGQAVDNEVLRATMRGIEDQNAHLSGDEVQAMIDTACTDVRSEFWRNQKWWAE
jgi:hypothetical protein